MPSKRHDQDASPPADTDRREPVNVLVVDDQPENLISMEALLNTLEIHLVLTRSGKEALRAVLDYDFALILLDVQMPTMDGFETAEIIRQRERSRHTPIIFVTAINKSERNIFQGYSFGAVDYIFKPFMPEVVKSKVEVFVELYRKTAEIKKQNEHLERVNQELEIYSQTIAHDLQALMGGLSSMADTLLSKTAQTDAALAKALDQETFKTRRLLGSLLEFSQIGGRQLSIKSVPLEPLVRGIINDLLLEQESPRVKWQVSELPVVQADEALLGTAMRNLLSNAFRWTKDSAAPGVEIGSYRDDAQESVIYVKDGGSGGEAADEEDLEGSGIALAVAQRIIRRHGGRFWAHQEPPRGSVIYFTLPPPRGNTRTPGRRG